MQILTTNSFVNHNKNFKPATDTSKPAEAALAD